MKGYKRNKYLDDLGIPINEYGTNFCDKTDPRWKQWKKERKKYGFDARECWNLDTMFVEWIYSHFMKYKEDCGDKIDLTFYTFTYQDKEVTQKEAIDIICEACKEYLLGDFVTRTFLSKDIMVLLKDIMPAMWW